MFFYELILLRNVLCHLYMYAHALEITGDATFVMTIMYWKKLLPFSRHFFVQSVEHISKNTCVSSVFMCECPKKIYLSYVVDMWDFVDVNYLAENPEFQNVCKSDPRCLN